jgi:hypothetical protein
MATEVYSCRPGQKLKEGRLDYSDIDTREQAEVDAKRRIQLDPGLEKIAYYAVTEDGRFRVIYSYTNPNPGAAKKPRQGSGALGSRPRGTAKPPPKPKSWLEKLAGLFNRGE